MAEAVDVSATNTSNLDNLLQDVAKSFSEQEMKDAVNWTKNFLQGEYTKLPEDNLSKCFDLLRQHGRVSETDTSAIEFYAEKFCKEEATMGSISKEIQTFKGKVQLAQQDTAHAAQFIGRDEDVRKILDELQTQPRADSSREDIRAINLHGEGGVGKTCLALEVARQLRVNSDCKSIVVNLRDIKEIQHVYFEVLRKFGQPAVFGSPERIYRSIENLKHELVLVFDNTEYFFMNFQDFKTFLTNMIQHDKQRRLQILLTSRMMLDGVAQVSNYPVKPFAKDVSKEILLQRTGFNLSVSLMSDMADLCHNKPLLLKGIAGILKEKLAVGEDVLASIEMNISEGRSKKTKKISGKMERRTKREVEVTQPGTDLSNNDGAVLREMFSKLSEPLINFLVKLSLFCRDFPLPAAQQMLGRSTKETLWYLNILRSKGCVESKRNEGGEKMFDLHPLMQEFLKDVTNTPEYQAVYQEAKVLFCYLFRNKLKELVHDLDTDFVQVYSDFELDRQNFEQLLKLSPGKEFLTLFQDVRELYLFPCLLQPLLTVQEREYLFHSLAETAVHEGNWPFAANLKCWEALQVNQTQGGRKAREVLDETVSFLMKEPEKHSDQYEGAESTYLYANGKTYYTSSYSETNQKYLFCYRALESLQQSLELTEKIYGKHTATARCLNEMGNCYNRLGNLEMAYAYYERAYKTRKELSGSIDHYDMAVDLNQISVVHEKMGVKLLKEKKTEAEGKRELTKAIEFYEKALDLEIKLKIDGYSNTALIKRNMANAYLHLEEPEKAWKPASEAYEIRQRVLGTHPDTVRSLFQLGNVKYWSDDYPAALEYFYKADQMEESLPEGHHSAVRQLIKKRILVTGGKLKDESGQPDVKTTLCERCFKTVSVSRLVDEIPNRVTENKPSSGDVRKISVLSLCDEWGSSKGGLSTFNRQLAVHLAKVRTLDVYCYLTEASDVERECANESDVTLVTTKADPGSPDLFLSIHQPPPELPCPDIVISHGRKFGTAAYSIHEQHSSCKWVHFVHVDCEEMAKHKDNPNALSENNDKDLDEVKFCKEADLAVAVGPSLAEKYNTDLIRAGKKVEVFIPGLSEEFLNLPQSDEDKREFHIYIFARGSEEDFHLKGFDIAADTVAILGEGYKLYSVCALTGQENEVRNRFLRKTKIENKQLNVLGYCNDRGRLKNLMCRADVIVMPSRAEAFGLIGLEALSAGIPVLVSAVSGLGIVMKNLVHGDACVVESDQPREWAMKIKSLRKKARSLRNAEATDLITKYGEAYCWDKECSKLAKLFCSLNRKRLCRKRETQLSS